MFMTLNTLLTEAKLVFMQHFCMAHPAFLRQYGIFVKPTGARK